MTGQNFFGCMPVRYTDSMKVVEKYSEGGSYKKKFGVSTQHYSFAVKAFVDMVQKFDVSEIMNLPSGRQRLQM